MLETALRPIKMRIDIYGSGNYNGKTIPFPSDFIDDALSQNILYHCYEQAKNVEELAKLCGVPAYYVEDRLEKPPENEDLVLCEYCAACAANYSYVLARLSREKNLVTSAGLYTADMSDSSLKEGAKELFLNARAQIEGLFGGSFVFMGV